MLVHPERDECPGAPGWTNALGLPDGSSYVVFLIDGLGLESVA